MSGPSSSSRCLALSTLGLPGPQLHQLLHPVLDQVVDLVQLGPAAERRSIPEPPGLCKFMACQALVRGFGSLFYLLLGVQAKLEVSNREASSIQISWYQVSQTTVSYLEPITPTYLATWALQVRFLSVPRGTSHTWGAP